MAGNREYKSDVNGHKENGYDSLEHCIERAIDRCIEENVLRDFLIRRRTEVVEAMKLDYTFDRQLVLEREEAIRYSVKQALKYGATMEEAISDIMDEYGITEEHVRSILNNE